MTQKELKPYITRLTIARNNWINSNPQDETEVNDAWKVYQIALTNYRNVKGV
jgi:hypothetical protein